MSKDYSKYDNLGDSNLYYNSSSRKQPQCESKNPYWPDSSSCPSRPSCNPSRPSDQSAPSACVRPNNCWPRQASNCDSVQNNHSNRHCNITAKQPHCAKNTAYNDRPRCNLSSPNICTRDQPKNNQIETNVKSSCGQASIQSRPQGSCNRQVSCSKANQAKPQVSCRRITRPQPQAPCSTTNQAQPQGHCSTTNQTQPQRASCKRVSKPQPQKPRKPQKQGPCSQAVAGSDSDTSSSSSSSSSDSSCSDIEVSRDESLQTDELSHCAPGIGCGDGSIGENSVRGATNQLNTLCLMDGTLDVSAIISDTSFRSDVESDGSVPCSTPFSDHGNIEFNLEVDSPRWDSFL